MRRIIERKVTVVTTTTWTISWQDVPPPQSSSEADAVQPTESNTDVLPAAQNTSSIIEPKEAEIVEEEKIDNQTTKVRQTRKEIEP